MAWTQAQLDALETAIASGSLRVKFADKDVTYRSLDEMMRIRDTIRASLGTVSNQPQRIKSEYDRGL